MILLALNIWENELTFFFWEIRRCIKQGSLHVSRIKDLQTSSSDVKLSNAVGNPRFSSFPETALALVR